MFPKLKPKPEKQVTRLSYGSIRNVWNIVFLKKKNLVEMPDKCWIRSLLLSKQINNQTERAGNKNGKRATGNGQKSEREMEEQIRIFFSRICIEILGRSE